MPYLILSSDNAVEDVVAKDTLGAVFIDDIDLIIEHPAGHVCFDYLGGELVLNAERDAAYMLQREKNKKVKDMIAAENQRLARGNLTDKINAVKNARNQAALDAIPIA